MIASLVKRLENLFFSHRFATLIVLGVVTVVMGFYAVQLRMSAGFDKQLPKGHEYINTFFQYRSEIFGANRVVVVVQSRKGDIWNAEGLKRLYDVTQTVFFLPGVDRRTVSSLWTPNTRVVEITDDGLQAEDVIGGDVTPDRLSKEQIARIRNNAIVGGYVGSLVASDNSGAMIVADLLESEPQTGKSLDYLDLAARLESEIRDKYEDDEFEVHIIGFAKQIGDIADGAKSVVLFFLLAFVLTAAAVYTYTRNWKMTFLPLFCSAVSVVWQFGTITLLGFGLDPLAVLVPFLVFAIGVSHGVQQINYMSKEICGGATSMAAARHSFTGLLIPGSMALVTTMVGFATLYLIPIPMIQELAITATLGVTYKIATNLVMLPVVASFFTFGSAYVERIGRIRSRRERGMRVLGRIAETRNAAIVIVVCAGLFGVAYFQSQGRHIGDIKPGVPELHSDSRFNRDAHSIVSKFDLGLDVLTVVVETPKDGCYSYPVMRFVDQFSWAMENVPGVLSVASVSTLAKLANSGLNEGNPKWMALPHETRALANAMSFVPEGSGLANSGCTMMPMHLYLADHKATTVKQVVSAVKEFRANNQEEGVAIRLASGNVGVQAATNEVLESTELPMMFYVYATIAALVLITYRDWRAVLACCMPLTLGTFLGYWFMKEMEIGLTVATLPVMVLAVGIGIDYAFYIYNGLQHHLARGADIVTAFQESLNEAGNATIFTAVTLSIGVATWSFSALKFQADMGILLTFMFMVNMIMAMTLLPALAVMIDHFLPRVRPVPAPVLEH